MSDEKPILEVENLSKHYQQSRTINETLLRKKTEPIMAVDDVSLSLKENEVKGVIGESGCGKTTLLMVLLALEGRTSGTIRFDGRDLSEYSKQEMKEFRKRVQVIFQDPFDSLDPKLTVRETLQASLEVHDIDDHESKIHDTLERVELRPPERYLNQYPNKLSGGEKQRVSIARALILDPEIILADEPVSMLDVSTQAVILKLLSKLINEEGLSMIYISHDLSTVGYICDEINVMYLGRLVESAPTMDLLEDPMHPYTQELIKAIPVPDSQSSRERTQLEGSTPDPIGLGEGCRFRGRCPEQMDICDTTPEFTSQGENRGVACHLHYDHQERRNRGEIGVDDDSGKADPGGIQ